VETVAGAGEVPDPPARVSATMRGVGEEEEEEEGR
jgi:hypothetical protein